MGIVKDDIFARKSRLLAVAIVVVTIGVAFLVSFATPALHLLNLRFNPFVILSAITTAITIGLSIFFVSKAARTDERIWLCLYLAIVALYTTAELMQRLSANVNAALFWYYVGTPIVVLPVSIYLFALAYTNQSERRYPGTVVTLLTGSLLLGFFYAFTNIIFVSNPKLALVMPWGYDFRRALGPAVSLSLLWNDGLLILALSRLISFRRHTHNVILRKQSVLFIYAISIPLGTGVVANVILPIAGLPNVLPVGTILAIPAALLLIYGILRYQLLTISPTLFSHTILAIMREAVVVTDERFRVIWLNAKAEKLLHTKADDRQQLALPTVLTDASRPTFHQAFEGEDRDVVDLDHLDISQSHEATIPVRLTASRLRLGDYDTWVMILSDITAELRTRSIIEHEVKVRTRELHEARAYLISSLNSLEQGFILVNREAEIELTNSAASTLLQAKAGATDNSEKLHSSTIRMPDWDIDLPKAVTHVLETHRARRLHVAAASGSFYEVYITPVLEANQMLGATIFIEDITEQKILDRSKDEFFSIASHELRTPLTAIRGNMSMAREFFAEALKKEDGLKDLVDDSHDASVRLISIVSDFLDSSRLEQGKMRFTIAAVAIAPIVDSIVADLKLMLEAHHNTITTVGVEHLPLALADEGRVRQILYNLVSNATIHNEHCAITVSGTADDHKLRLRVSDTGKGISPENQKLLFHKFQQASESILTRDNTKGTGLGLYIARLLALQMHGNVELEQSESGKGSTFILTLPRSSGREQSPKTAQPPTAAA